jgi:hypothetical protein
MIELIVIVSAVVQVVFLAVTIVRLSKVNKTLESHSKRIQGVSTIAENARHETDHLSHELAVLERQLHTYADIAATKYDRLREELDQQRAPDIGWHRRQAMAKYPAAPRHYDPRLDNYHPREEGE